MASTAEQLLTNILSMALLIVMLGYFIRRWMNGLEEQVRTLCSDVGDIRDKKLDITRCNEYRAVEENGTREIWSWLKYHRHTSEGHVIVPALKE